jgi:hypothetical protein
MQAVTTIGLDIAKSVFQARHRRGRQRAHPPSAEAPLRPGVLPEAAAVPRWYRGLRHVGFDTLTLVGRSLFAVCRRLSHSGRVVPGVMSRSTEAAEGGTRDEVSLDVEDVVNGDVEGDEALC